MYKNNSLLNRRNTITFAIFAFYVNIKKMKEINRLKEVLAEQKKTGKWLADNLGKDTATVSRWCNNHAQPSMETFVRIAGLLNIDVRELINKSK